MTYKQNPAEISQTKSGLVTP